MKLNFFHHLKHYSRKMYGWLCALLICGAISSFFMQAALQRFIEQMINNLEVHNFGFMTYGVSFYACGYLLVWVLGDSLLYVSRLCGTYVYPVLEKDIRMDIFNKVQNSNIAYMIKHNAGFIENYIDCFAEGIRECVQTFSEDIFPGICFTLVSLIFFTIVHPLLSISTLIWIVLHSTVYYFGFKPVIKYCKLNNQWSNERTGKMMDFLNNFLTTKVFNIENYAMNNIGHTHEIERDYYAKYIQTNANVNLFVSILGMVFQGAIFLAIMYYALTVRHLSIGTIVSVCTLNFWVVHNVWDVSDKTASLLQSFGQTLQSVDLINDIPQHYPGHDDPTHDSLVVTKLSGKIQFKNLNIKFDNREIVKNLNYTINPGDKVMIFGASGAGKSSILNALMKLNKTSEEIFVDDIDVNEYETQSYRKCISYITQSNCILKETIYENIAIGNLEAANIHSVIQAATKAGIHDFIDTLPLKYNTILSNGILSGGQIQRICIARALMENANIIVADEPTSALDRINSRNICKTILDICSNTYGEPKTLIWIAHDVSFANRTDVKIIFLSNDGYHIGSHAELLATVAEYKEFWY